MRFPTLVWPLMFTALVSAVILALYLALGSPLHVLQPANVASVPQQKEPTIAAAAPIVSTVFAPPPTVDVPQPIGTIFPPTPGITPTEPEPTASPTMAVLQAARIVTPAVVSSVHLGLDLHLTLQSSFRNGQLAPIPADPLAAIAWSPIGDKLLYPTSPYSSAGDLVWSNLDGSSTTHIKSYAEMSAELTDQLPLTNTLLVRHLGPQLPMSFNRVHSHFDVITFVSDQPPSVTDGPDLAHLPYSLHWWGPDRASGVARADATGGDLLVTVDGHGNLVEERNIPYMISGAVQPGGEWLAYSHTNQFFDKQLEGYVSGADFLLNLHTGQRLQLTAEGQGNGIEGWSPDGKWILMYGKVVSADGREQITFAPHSYDTISNSNWSPDSRYIAYTVGDGGGCDAEQVGPCPIATGQVYIADLATKTYMVVGGNSDSTAKGKSNSLLGYPRWSPDGKRLVLVSYNPNCGQCPEQFATYLVMLLER